MGAEFPTADAVFDLAEGIRQDLLSYHLLQGAYGEDEGEQEETPEETSSMYLLPLPIPAFPDLSQSYLSPTLNLRRRMTMTLQATLEQALLIVESDLDDNSDEDILETIEEELYDEQGSAMVRMTTNQSGNACRHVHEMNSDDDSLEK